MSHTDTEKQLVDIIPINVGHLVEVGAKATSIRERYLRRNPSADYWIINPLDAAADPQALESEPGVMRNPDAVIIVEPEGQQALERVLGRYHSLCGEAAVCIIAVENAGYWNRLLALMQGKNHFADAAGALRADGAMSLEQLQAAVRQSGWHVERVSGLKDASVESDAAVSMLSGAAEKLGIDSRIAQQQLSTRTWLVRCVNSRLKKRETISALTIKKVAGVNEARIDHPLRALGSLPGYNLAWSAAEIRIPQNWTPGVYILHRKFMNSPEFNHKIESLIASGWVIVSEIDDDPHHWRGFIDNDFLAFRGVHAVTVSTEPLADMIRQWNPNVQVFDNAIFELPHVSPNVPKQGNKLRLFFGALNRAADWREIHTAILEAVEVLGNKVEIVVIHDREVFDSLPPHIEKSFHPTMSLPAYMDLLATCDIALLPLQDTPFNRLKSDLKFIECCAAGVVPICSPVVYGQRAEHLDIGCFATTPEQWREHLLSLCQNPEELRARRQKGWNYVVASRMHAHQVVKRQQFYQSLIQRRDELEQQRQLRLQKSDGSGGAGP